MVPLNQKARMHPGGLGRGNEWGEMEVEVIGNGKGWGS